MAMGQTEGQVIIARLHYAIEEASFIAMNMAPEDAYTNIPMADIMMARHEQLYSRLFMS